MQNKNTAFTLVELIVVITILAILGTIAFISLQGYSSESRDSKRISDLGQIRTGLGIEQAREGVVPMPEESVTVTNSGSNLTIQGYAGTGTLNTLRISDNAKDPSDNKYYTYTINANRTKFQLVTMLENTQTASNNNILITTTYADYTNRNAYPIGEPLGTLLDSTTKAPIQETSSGVIDLSTDNTEYIPVFTKQNNEETSSGKILLNQINSGEFLKGWRAEDPNCKIEDITIGNQTWAGCNSTLGDGLEWGQTDDDIGTNNYSGNVESCYDYNGISDSSDIDCGIGNPIMQSNKSAKKFFDKQQKNGKNLNGDSEFDTIWGKFYTWNNSASACPNGWHVPTDTELTNLITTLNGGVTCETGTGWQCEGLGWKSHNTISKDSTNNLVNALKIPLAGYRYPDGYTFYNRGSTTLLWSSTPSSTSAYHRYLNWGNNSVNRNTISINYALFVRCIKD